MNDLLGLIRCYFELERSSLLDEFLRLHYGYSGNQLCDLAEFAANNEATEALVSEVALVSELNKSPEAYSTLSKHLIYPAAHEVFRAFALCKQPKVLILGQDPYHDGCACGLAFASRAKIAPSLRTIAKELALEAAAEYGGCDDMVIAHFIKKAPELNEQALVLWAKQGVMLLNTALSVAPAHPGSHIYIWKDFTNYVIANLNCDVAMLWGAKSRQFAALLKPFTKVLTAAHPSPLARGKFLGCGHFNMANMHLKSLGKSPIKWLN